jgi:hypothetical protein
MPKLPPSNRLDGADRQGGEAVVIGDDAWERLMAGRFLVIAAMVAAMVLGLTLDLVCGATAQTPSPEARAAARNLVLTMKLDDQYKAMLPTILLGLKPVVVQDRPEIERDYDAMGAMMVDTYAPFYNAMLDAAASIYADSFTVEELRQIETFYRLPVGQKLLEKSPALAQQRDTAVQDLGRKASDEIKARLTDALRQKGHKL